MKREHKYMLGGALAVIALAGVAAGSIAAYQSMQKPQAAKQEARVVHYQPTAMQGQQRVQAQPPCDDNNIVGTLGGGVAGGLIGSRFGSGNGKTVATAAGALGGAALGNKYIPTRGATCN